MGGTQCTPGSDPLQEVQTVNLLQLLDESLLHRLRKSPRLSITSRLTFPRVRMIQGMNTVIYLDQRRLHWRALRSGAFDADASGDVLQHIVPDHIEDLISPMGQIHATI